RVDEVLGELDAAGQAGDVGPDVDPVQRQVAAIGAQGAEARVVAWCGSVGRFGLAHRRDGDGHDGLHSSHSSRPRSASKSMSGPTAAWIAERSSGPGWPG